MDWLHMHYSSQILGMPVPMEVLLPKCKTGENSKGSSTYQTLYLLHGMGDDHTAWLRKTCLERYSEGLPLAIIMPNAHLGWYTDMQYGKNYFQFITKELPAICERMFPLSNRREDRFIAGVSMGGYGAVKAALCVPEVFGVAASFSGALDVTEVYEQLDKRLAADIFGNNEEIKGSVNDLFAGIDRLIQSGKKQPRFHIWCGTEDKFYASNIKFKNYVLEHGLDITYEESVGDHQWKYWDQRLEKLLSWLPLNRNSRGEE